jgi:CRP-like cAMP-binding protein
VLGELAVLDGGARSADATAASPEVHLIAISRAQVFAILEGSSGVATALIRELCARVRNASDMFEVKSEKSARIRLARTLLQLAAKWGRGDGMETLIPNFSQSELGDFAGLARENVNRQLKAWEDESLIRRDADGITLLDTDAIALEAQL